MVVKPSVVQFVCTFGQIPHGAYHEIDGLKFKRPVPHMTLKYGEKRDVKHYSPLS